MCSFQLPLTHPSGATNRRFKGGAQDISRVLDRIGQRRLDNLTGWSVSTHAQSRNDERKPCDRHSHHSKQAVRRGFGTFGGARLAQNTHLMLGSRHLRPAQLMLDSLHHSGFALHDAGPLAE